MIELDPEVINQQIQAQSTNQALTNLSFPTLPHQCIAIEGNSEMDTVDAIATDITLPTVIGIIDVTTIATTEPRTGGAQSRRVKSYGTQKRRIPSQVLNK